MTDEVLDVPSFLRHGAAAHDPTDQALVDRAIERADLLAKLRRCRLAIDLLKRRHTDELNAAAIELANAHDELEAFTREAGRAS